MKILKNKIIKKIGIVMMCFALVFGSITAKTSRVKALAGVDDLAYAAVICALLACAGVVMNNDSFQQNASKLVGQAKDSFASFVEGTVDVSKNALDTLVTGAVNTGKIACDKINELGGWLNNFVNDFIIPEYKINKELDENTPLFKFDVPIYKGYVPFYDSSVGVESLSITGGLSGYTYKKLLNSLVSVYFGEWKFSNNLYAMGAIQYGNDSSLKYISLQCEKNGSVYVSLVGSGYYPYPTRGSFSDGDSTSSITADWTGGIYVTGQKPVVIKDESGKILACYGFNGANWTADMDGVLELDPDLYNKPEEGALDLPEYYRDLYNKLNNTIDRGYVLGHDAVFDNAGNLVNSGTVSIPKDYTSDWANTSDYPYVLDKDLSNVVAGDVTTTYPEATFPTVDSSYQADWTEVFPFCIPFDIFKFINLFCANPETPKFTWHYNFLGVTGDLTVDLSPFDSVAALTRNLFDVLFIVGLAMITRSQLIRA